MGRHMLFTNALAEKAKGSHASMDVLAEAKSINVPTIVNRVMGARKEGHFTLACALSLDMIIHRIRTVRDGYRREAQKAIESGDTGLVVKLNAEWMGCRPEEDGPGPLRSMAERLIADTLFEIYERSDGALGHAQWRKRAEEIRDELIGSVSERIAKTENAGMSFLSITVAELDLVGMIWIAGLEQAESRVFAEEKKHSRSRAPAAS